MARKRTVRSSRFAVLFSTAGNLDEATRIAEHLVERRLVACVNLIPMVHSIYWWDNKVNRDQEVLLILKTEKRKIGEIEKTVRSLHSYQTPELIALPLVSGLQEYLKWMEDSLTSKKGRSAK